MKKCFKILSYVIVIIIILCAILYFARNILIARSVEKIAPSFTGTPVALESVDLQIFKGTLSLRNLKVGNPQGFSQKDIFAVDKVDVALKPLSLFGNKIVIKNITVDGVTLNYEISGNKSNLSVIQDNLTGGAKKPAQQSKAKPKAAPKDEKAAKSVVIDTLLIENVRAGAYVSGVGMTLALPSVRLKDIGKSKPSTMRDVIEKVLTVFSKETVSAISKETVKAVKDGQKSLGRFIEKLF